MAQPKRFATDKKAAKDLAAGLTRLNDNQLACRDMRHAWAVEQDFHVEPDQVAGKRIQSIRRILVCMRGCETRRVEKYVSGRFGLDKISQHYVYFGAYEIPGVPRGVKPQSIIQQEAYRRAMERVANAQPGERETAER